MKRLYWIACSLALTILLIFTLAVPATSHATTATPTPNEVVLKPLFVLIEYDPWRMVIGSDSPSFALYDNGLVIFLGEDEDGKATYFSTELDAESFEKLSEQLKAGEAFFALDPYYDLMLKTDQPTSTIIAWDEDGKAKRVGVYGDLRQDEEARDQTPQAFLELFDVAVAYENDNVSLWLPEKFEVIVWEYETSDATTWPKNWPDLNDPSTVKRDQVYSIYLDSDELPTFRKLAEDASGFLINGKTYTFSVRYPFPNEDAWQKLKNS